MASIGLFDIDAATATDQAVLEDRIRATIDAGEQVIRFAGCDYGVVADIVRRLHSQGNNVIGLQQENDPPEYFIAGCSSVPVMRDDTSCQEKA